MASMPRSGLTEEKKPKARATLRTLGSGVDSFEPNMGQTDPSVRFIGRSGSSLFWFKPNEVLLSAGKAPLSIKFLGANSEPKINGQGKRHGVVNYLKPENPAGSVNGVPTYRSIVYRGLYQGVDLQYDRARKRGLKGTYTIQPGVNPNLIRWQYRNAESVFVNAKGSLVIRPRTRLNGKALEPEERTLIEQRPVAWQYVGKERVPVPVEYRVGTRSTIRFVAGAYDLSRPLVIDPTLVYSSYLGGTHRDLGYAAAVNKEGTAAFTGLTDSVDFHCTNPCTSSKGGPESNGYLSKVSRDGQLIFSSYLEGTAIGRGVAFDNLGNTYVTGGTNDPNPPNGGNGRLAYVSKLGPTGTLVYFKKFGGTRILGPNGGAGGARAEAVAVDGNGSAYVTGLTTSWDMGTKGSFQENPPNPYYPNYPSDYDPSGFNDAFVTKLSSDGGSLEYSTYLGGRSRDWARGIAVDSGGNAVVVGFTQSPDFPQRNAVPGSGRGGLSDAFVTKLSSDGRSLIYSTYFGAPDDQDESLVANEAANAVAVDFQGNAYVTGGSTSYLMPETFSLGVPRTDRKDGGFAAKFNKDGQLDYATNIGPYGFGIGVDGSGRAYITGVSGPSSSLGAGGECGTLPIWSATEGAFVLALSPQGNSVLYHARLGAGRGAGIAVDTAGAVQITGEITPSNNVPPNLATKQAFQPSPAGSQEAFVASLSAPLFGPLCAPANPLALVAKTISVSQIDLTWVKTEGSLLYKVERSQTADGPWVQIGTTVESDYSDKELHPATTYWYKVRASNAAGDSGYSNIASATTFPLAGQPPPPGTPEVTGIDPARGPLTGGTSVAIKGRNFTEVSEVLFGGGLVNRACPPAPAPPTDACLRPVDDGNVIAVTPPSDKAGKVHVQVRAKGGLSPQTPADLFEYIDDKVPPLVTDPPAPGGPAVSTGGFTPAAPPAPPAPPSGSSAIGPALGPNLAPSSSVYTAPVSNAASVTSKAPAAQAVAPPSYQPTSVAIPGFGAVPAEESGHEAAPGRADTYTMTAWSSPGTSSVVAWSLGSLAVAAAFACFSRKDRHLALHEAPSPKGAY